MWRWSPWSKAAKDGAFFVVGGRGWKVALWRMKVYVGWLDALPSISSPTGCREVLACGGGEEGSSAFAGLGESSGCPQGIVLCWVSFPGEQSERRFGCLLCRSS